MRPLLSLLAVLLLAGCGSPEITPTSGAMALPAHAAGLGQPVTGTPTSAPTKSAVIRTGTPSPTAAQSATATMGAPSVTTPSQASGTPDAPIATPQRTGPTVPGVVAENVGPLRSELLWIHAMGEVVNRSAVEVYVHYVEVRFLDSDGVVFHGSNALNMGTPILKPGERTVWRALLNGLRIEDWEDVRATPIAEPVTDALRSTVYLDVQVDELTMTPGAQPGKARVSGRVSNVGTVTPRLVIITTGLYDAAGRLIGFSNGYVQARELPPGASAPFFPHEFTALPEQPARAVAYVIGLPERQASGPDGGQPVEAALSRQAAHAEPFSE